MSVTITAIDRLDDAFYLVSFSSTLPAPVFYIFVDGVLSSTQAGGSYVAPAGAVVEVLDDPATAAQPAFPAVLVLGWVDDADAAAYRIEQKIGGLWTAVVTRHNTGEPWQSYATGPLEDGSTQEWRIIPLDAAGNDGSGASFVSLMVRYPDVPDVAYSYDNGTGTVTVAAA